MITVHHRLAHSLPNFSQHVSGSGDPLHPPAFPTHTIPSAFPHQPERERQAYEQMRENQLHNVRFMTLLRRGYPASSKAFVPPSLSHSHLA